MSSKTDTDVVEKVKIGIPKDYKVILLNDDSTSFEFVIEVLMLIFNKKMKQGHDIAKEVHEKGSCVVAVYPKSIADMKVKEVHVLAAQNFFPLKCISERED